MAEESGRSSKIRDWIQTFFIGAGIVAGIWQFVFKEIWAPAGAPINLTTEVTVKQAGFKGPVQETSNEQLEAIELTIAARNPSTRDVWLLSNCWYAHGIRISAGKENEDWTNIITAQIKDHAPSYEGAFYEWSKPVAVAAGEVFPEDQLLHPNELIATSLIFYVPQGAYDLMRVHIELPTTPVANSMEVAWTVTPDKGCDSRVYRTKPDGKRGVEITDFPKAFKDRTLQYQVATSTRELSLWQNKQSAAASTSPAGASPRR